MFRLTLFFDRLFHTKKEKYKTTVVGRLDSFIKIIKYIIYKFEKISKAYKNICMCIQLTDVIRDD